MNREAFDGEPLPEGHFERFEQKLGYPDKSRTLRYALYAFAVAACIALLFLFRFPETTFLHPSPDKVMTAQPTCGIEQEIEELRLYYTMQMNDILTQMRAIYSCRQYPGVAELLQDTQQLLAENDMFEETVLPELPCSSDGLYAMNLHYTSNIETLLFLLKQMENMKAINKE